MSRHEDRRSRRAPRSRFARAAVWTSRLVGRPVAFSIAAGSVVLWGLAGPLFDFSDSWQLVINTGTTIATFLMVFLIQNAQNRDSEAIQLKLDELIVATREAHNALLNVENLDEKELDRLRQHFEILADEDGPSGSDPNARAHGRRASGET
jgi:low affinity Fe/Cu permease